MVANAGQILNSTTPDQDDRVLLQIVSFAANVTSNLETVSQTNARDLAHRRIWLLRCRRIYACTHAALLWRGSEGWNIALHWLR